MVPESVASPIVERPDALDISIPVEDSSLPPAVAPAPLRCRVLGEGPPVLFIHGTAAAVWGDLPQRVGAFARALTYDRRGFAGIDASAVHAPTARLPVHAADAAALLEVHAPHERAVLVGWSTGGVIALEVAARWPSLVAGLVLLEPPLYAKRHPGLNLLGAMVLSSGLGVLTDPVRGGRRFSRWLFRETDGHRNPLDELPAQARELIDANAAAALVESRGGTGEHLSAARLAALCANTVIFAGGRSQAFLREGARRAASLVPGAQYVELHAATHFLQFDAAPTIAVAVRRMVAQRIAAVSTPVVGRAGLEPATPGL